MCVHKLAPGAQRQGAEASIWTSYVYGILYVSRMITCPNSTASETLLAKLIRFVL